MTPSELEASIARHIGTRPPRQYPSAADHRAAFVDYLKLAARQPVDDPEPLARSWNRDRLSVYEVQERAGLTAADFGDAMESSVSLLLRQNFADVSGDIAAVTRPVPVPNFRPVELPSFSMGAPDEQVEEADYPIMPVVITESASAGQLRSYGSTVRFSRAVFQTHGPAILDAMTSYARIFYLKEMELLVGLLESATLPTKSGLTFNAAGLNTSLAELRTQTNSAAQLANWSTRSIIVPADLEGAALTLKQSMGAAFRVIVMPGLSVATTWFLCTDNSNSPLLRMTLGNGQPSVFLNRRRGVELGAEFALSHDVAFSVAGDTSGILKCTA